MPAPVMCISLLSMSVPATAVQQISTTLRLPRITDKPTSPLQGHATRQPSKLYPINHCPTRALLRPLEIHSCRRLWHAGGAVLLWGGSVQGVPAPLPLTCLLISWPSGVIMTISPGCTSLTRSNAMGPKAQSSEAMAHSMPLRSAEGRLPMTRGRIPWGSRNATKPTCGNGVRGVE
jgi:hypothetical protein